MNQFKKLLSLLNSTNLAFSYAGALIKNVCL